MIKYRCIKCGRLIDIEILGKADKKMEVKIICSRCTAGKEAKDGKATTTIAR